MRAAKKPQRKWIGQAGRFERPLESLGRLTSGGLFLYEASLCKLGDVVDLSNALTPVQRIKKDEEAGKYISNKGTRKISRN